VEAYIKTEITRRLFISSAFINVVFQLWPEHQDLSTCQCNILPTQNTGRNRRCGWRQLQW